jgi:hypothetical protein
MISDDGDSVMEVVSPTKVLFGSSSGPSFVRQEFIVNTDKVLNSSDSPIYETMGRRVTHFCTDRLDSPLLMVSDVFFVVSTIMLLACLYHLFIATRSTVHHLRSNNKKGV